MLKDGIVSKLQMPIVSQQKLLIVIHFFHRGSWQTIIWPFLAIAWRFCVFRNPGDPSLSIFTCLEPYVNDVYTSVKGNTSPFQEKIFTCKFLHQRTTHSKTLAPFLHYEWMENVLTLKIRYIDNP